jgi:hypothetical protein
MGAMAEGMAHFFHNIQMSALGNISAASKQIVAGSEAAKTLAIVHRSVSRAAELAAKLVVFSSGGKPEQKSIDLASVLRGAQDLLDVAAGPHCRVVIQIDSSHLPIVGNPQQLEHLLVNLVRNAAEAMTHARGEVVVRLERRSLQGNVPAGLVGTDTPEPGEYAAIVVTDNGSGISPEALRHVFEPFYSTKLVGRGLGLAMSADIVRGHHGFMAARSTLNVGSTFEVIIPLRASVPGVQVEPKPVVARGKAPGTCRTVLVVDDEQLVRNTLRNMLQSLGVQVAEVDSGALAIERLRSGPVPDCVLLDLTMPGMDGVRTLRELRAFCPELPVVLCSGYARSNLEPWVMNDPLVGFLPKPHTLNELAALLGEIAGKGERTAAN